MKKVIVIGGGASGMISAITCARNGHEVMIIEKNNNVGKKLLITGAGKCNYWNEDMSINHYRSTDISLLDKVINKNNLKLVLDLFDSIGIIPRIKNGYYYPYSNLSISIENALVLELKRLTVDIITNTEVINIIKDNSFIVETNNKKYKSDTLIISTGSCAAPKTGTDGKSYSLLTTLGHSLIKPLPALVPLISDKKYLNKWAGIRTDVKVLLYEDNNLKGEEQGEAQLTDYGISGICMMNLSGRISRGLENKKKEVLIINFIPFLNKTSFINFMNERDNKLENRTVIELLESIINYKLLYVLLKEACVNDITWSSLSNDDKDKLATYITEFRLEITGTKNFEHAQVISGGIPLKEINIDTFESNIINDLYITGEVLDVDGDCGGYNLGFAWISGIIAGLAIK